MRKPPLFAGLVALMALGAFKKKGDTKPLMRPEDSIFQPGSFSGRRGSYFAGHTIPSKLRKSRLRMFKQSRVSSRNNAKKWTDGCNMANIMSSRKQYKDALTRSKQKCLELRIEILGFSKVNKELIARVDQLQKQLDRLKNTKWWQVIRLVKLLRS